MVALGTTFSAFWIMVNNSWMQAPVGYQLEDGLYVPTDWAAIIFRTPSCGSRFPHMLIAAYLTGAFCVAATGAWYRLRNSYAIEGRVMLRMGLFLAAGLVPLQLFFGHLNGDYVHERQPIKFAAIEGRWHDEQPAAEAVIAIPDDTAERNSFEFRHPVSRQLDRLDAFRLQGSRPDRLSEKRSATGGHPVLRLSRDGRLRPPDACHRLVRLLVRIQRDDGSAAEVAVGRPSCRFPCRSSPR